MNLGTWPWCIYENKEGLAKERFVTLYVEESQKHISKRGSLQPSINYLQAKNFDHVRKDIHTLEKVGIQIQDEHPDNLDVQIKVKNH